MKYKNDTLPAVVKRSIENAITALVDKESLRGYSLCPANSLDHVALAVSSSVYDVIIEFVYSDKALDNDEVVELINGNKFIPVLQRDASNWVAFEMRKKYPAND